MDQINIGKKIRIRREQLGYSLQDVANTLEVHRSTIMRWENGETNRIKLPTIEKLAQILQTSPGFLMGYEESTETTTSRNSSPDDACFLPVVKSLYADQRLFETQNIVNYELADAHFRYNHCFYWFVSGDAMAPSLEDSDRVLIKQQDHIKDGQLGVFLLDEKDYVIRKFYSKNAIELRACNPYYPAIKLSKEEQHRLKIIGVVLESKRQW
ncbi:MAG: LexA family transcriptional regulator [Ruminococcaceae bacterium]|nr:LexA family transcriptional regulator [Oscillospiraceae bacterium]